MSTKRTYRFAVTALTFLALCSAAFAAKTNELPECHPGVCTNAPCEVCCTPDGNPAPESSSSDTTCQGCSNPRVPGLTLDNSYVRVLDTPIWFDDPKGPAFQFFIQYNDRDGRSRYDQTWRLGYKWQDAYNCYVVSNGADRMFHTGGDRTYTFTTNGLGGYTASQK